MSTPISRSTQRFLALPLNVSKQIQARFGKVVTGSATQQNLNVQTANGLPNTSKPTQALQTTQPSQQKNGEERTVVPQISERLRAYLAPAQLELLTDSLSLLELHTHAALFPQFHDYSFVVFPAAKAFEGFLKLFFWRMELITDEEYHGRRWRVGRSFNPDLPGRFRDESWVYDDVSQQCSLDVAKQLWDAWLEGRNHVVHFFPDERYELDLPESAALVKKIISAMEAAVQCT